MNRLFRLIVWIAAIVLLAGCGKNMPVIDPQALQNKHSLLVVTGPELAPETKQQLQTALNEWRDTRQTAFEWHMDVTALTEAQLAGIQTRNYDYVVVVGHSLIQATIPYAEQITNRKWILLDDQIVRETWSVQGQHIMVKAILESQLRSDWDEWVRQQLVSGRLIEWVTTSAYPIPSEWAPAEEAEFISLSDAEGWYSQLQFQVRSHQPAWIVVFAPLENDKLSRLRYLQVPIVNMAASAVELRWNAILGSLQTLMTDGAWTPGLQPYGPQEAAVKKNF